MASFSSVVDSRRGQTLEALGCFHAIHYTIEA
jgi:hypothetical protein